MPRSVRSHAALGKTGSMPYTCRRSLVVVGNFVSWRQLAKLNVELVPSAGAREWADQSCMSLKHTLRLWGEQIPT
jgi:hypothetical protein